MLPGHPVRSAPSPCSDLQVTIKKSHKKSKKHHQDAIAQVIGGDVLPETSLPCHCVIVTAMTFD